MRKFKWVPGLRFGRLTLVAPGDSYTSGGARWDCLCDCGSMRLVSVSNLLSGGTQSCGCLRNERVTAALQKHGCNRKGLRTKAYRTWAHILDRCNNPSSASYKNYGARGITVCEKWHTFEGFLEDMGEPSYELTIDRVNNEAGYSKDNCRWVTRSIQARNTRRNIIYNGLCLKDACSMSGVSYEAAQQRIRRGQSVEDAMQNLACARSKAGGDL